MTEEDIVRKTPKKKNILIRALIFIVIAGLLTVYLNEVFNLADSDSNKRIFNAFYAEEENTIDAVYFGTSASNRYFISPMAYDREGMAVFVLAAMGMPLFFVPELMEEVEKTQQPELYIIELRWLLKEREQLTDAHIRRVTDSMKYSSNRSDAIEKAMEFTEDTDGALGDISHSKLDYYIPVIKYHSRLSAGDLGPGDIFLLNSKNKTKGYVTSPKTTQQVPQDKAVYSQERADLSPEAEEVLYELLDYCDGLKDKEVLFVLSPYSMKEGQAAKFNTAIDIVTDRGYDVLNFNTEEMVQTLQLDWSTDFYNSKHVNYLGAEKYTRYLTDYLKDNYRLEDHRGDEDYASWDEAYSEYLDYVSANGSK